MHFQKPTLGVPLDWSNHLNKDLVMHLAMNEGYGDVVRDLSMNGNHGTMNNFAFPPTVASGWNPGRAGIGANFDGTDDYISIPDSGSLRATEAITISMYYRYIGNASGDYTPLVENDGAFRLHSGTVAQGNRHFAHINIAGTGWVSSPHHVISNGDWHLWTAVYSPDIGVGLYVDGDFVGATPASGAIVEAANPITVGGSTTRSTNGSIDQVRIQSRAWSAKEVRDYYINPWQVYLDEEGM